MNNSYLINLHIDLTPAEIRDRVIKRALPYVEEGSGVSVAIDGFDADIRELWEIPEVREFCKMLVEEGMLGILRTPTFKEDGTLELGDFRGSFEVYLMSRNLMVNPLAVESSVLADYIDELYRANALLDSRYGPPETWRENAQISASGYKD
jgi:hypothetical protein